MTRKFHNWTDDDEAALLDAVERCAPLFEHFREQGKSYGEGNAWDAVAGCMLPGVVVTGKACQRRHGFILERVRAEALPEPAVWAETTALVEAYDRDMAEWTVDLHAENGRLLKRVATVVDSIARELGVEETWE